MPNEVTLVRTLAWMLVAAMFLNAITCTVTYGSTPGFLPWGATGLAGLLIITHPRQRKD